MSKDSKLIGQCINRIANGDLSRDIDASILKKNNDTGVIARAMQKIIDKQRLQTEALDKLTHGNFIISFPHELQEDPMSKSINKISSNMKLLESDFQSACDEFDSGNAWEKIYEEKYEGGYRRIVESSNSFIEKTNKPMEESSKIIAAMTVNNFNQRVSGEFTGSSKVFADNVNALCEKFSEIEKTLIKISNGDTTDAEKYKKIGKLSEDDTLVPALIIANESIGNFVEEVKAISEGKKPETDNAEGSYKEIVNNISSSIEAIDEPINEITYVLSHMAVNDLTVGFSSEFDGKFKQVADLIKEVENRMLLAEKISVDISNGDISKLDEVKSIGKLSDNDKTIPAAVNLMENINSLIKASSEMSEAAENGDLLYRIEGSNVNGEFTNIVNGFNKAFDMMSSPLIEMAASLENLASGNAHSMVTGNYKGVFETLVNDVNKINKHTLAIIKEITTTLNEIANGNLNVKKSEKLEGDWNVIPEALNNIIDSLNTLVGNIYNAVDEVAAGSQQVSTGSQELSQGATIQASSIEELTASIAEIASQTKFNAQNAGKASTLAKSMRNGALNGNSEMKEMLTSMEEINDSSRNISKIIKVIDDIAFQTNILALNAAVEAARAGEHGKGFAVVAEEVRNLAARSAKAANETTTLIEGSMKRVEKGSHIAADTAKTLGGIVESVDKVADLIENIAASSNEQATGITQVNQGLEQVSKVVQTNSATAEQSAAASEELSGQANILKGNVKKFSLRNSGSVNNAVTDNTSPKQSEEPKPAADFDGSFGKY